MYLKKINLYLKIFLYTQTINGAICVFSQKNVFFLRSISLNKMNSLKTLIRIDLKNKIPSTMLVRIVHLCNPINIIKEE